jgi:mercuric ion binding protein
MKKLIISTVLIFIGISTYAQNKNATAILEVDVCMMCKERIEKASIRTKGVKSAVWNVKTHELSVIYDERKTNLTTINENIALVGHDTKTIKASDEAYNSVHPCCLYREDKVIDDHDN